MDYVWIPIVTSIGLFTMICVIVVANANARKYRARVQAEVQNRLIDKFGSAPEFATFLSSPAGRQFLGEMERAPRITAHDRILRGVRSATVLTFLGLAFSLLAIFQDRDWLVPGLILLGLGIGYIISSVLMARLSKSWGLLEEPRPSGDCC